MLKKMRSDHCDRAKSTAVLLVMRPSDQERKKFKKQH